MKKGKSTPPPTAAGSSVSDLKQYIKRIPRDEGGYCQSFAVDDEEQWRPFFQEHGFVVIKILTQAECTETCNEFFATVNAMPPCDPYFLAPPVAAAAAVAGGGAPVAGAGGAPAAGAGGVNRKRPITQDDPASWEEGNWPLRTRFLVQHPAVSPCALHNRTHPKLHQLYTKLYGGHTNRVFASIDMWGVMRGSSGLVAPDDCDAEMANNWHSERPEWRQHLGAHWDVNPRSYIKDTRGPNGEFNPQAPPGTKQGAKKPILFQGVLALVDCDDSVGGFTIAPGSAVHLDKWVQAVPVQKAERPNHVDVSANDPWGVLTQNVPMRAGDYVVWDSGSLHANYANAGPAMRLVQYVRCCTDSVPSNDPQWTAHLPFPENLEKKHTGLDLGAEAAKAAIAGKPLSEQQLKMLGLIPYEDVKETKKGGGK